MDKRLEALFELYFKPNKDNYELEAKFGTKRSIAKMDFDNVISRLKTLGFTSKQSEYNLNIQNEFFDKKKGTQKMSNIRTEINGLTNIQMYCKNNKFNLANPPKYITFRQKKPIFVKNDRVMPIDYDDFGFRINFKEETILSKKNPLIKNILRNWNDNKKTFRFIKRFSFTHEDFPLQIDCSIVKSSKRSIRHRYIPTYNIQKSELFTRPEEYEIEIELSPRKKIQISQVELIKKFKLTWRYILSGIQGTNYPISYSEQNNVLKSYMEIIDKDTKKKKKKKKEKKRKINKQDFVGPSSVSLQFINIQPPNADVKAPNIRTGYTVTEKADGLRKLVFFAGNKLGGKVFLIDMNMNVQFTGCVNKTTALHNTIIDGEHVLYNKRGQFINKFLSFDLYYKSGKDYRSFPFIKGGSKITYQGDIDRNTFRLQELANIIGKDMKLESIIGESNNFTITGKTFHYASPKDAESFDIFAECGKIWKKDYEYEVDGLIFTPENTGINSQVAGQKIPPRKKRWDASFKWKPEKYNTVDFLISTKKLANGSDFMGNVFEGGKNTGEEEQLSQYKTLVLRVGYKPSYGFLNPCQYVISGNMPKKSSSQENYKPQPFFPTNPYDNDAHLTNVMLENSSISGAKYMFVEDKTQAFEDNTIVEFKYNKDGKAGWRWIPIRVRYDKTEDLRRTGNNFGNDYMTAQGVWQSIWNPITEEMITTGENIPDLETNDDVYYNIKSNKSNLTRSLRDFHNFVKRLIIVSVSEPGNTLMDLAVGKAGDLHKWIWARLAFVFGIDISRDNIENKKDGACTRYLKQKQKFGNMPDVLFMVGNSGLNVRNGEYCTTPQCKKITKAIFGEGAKDETVLGEYVYKQWGVGQEGFDIVSCQFAIHYFFENKITLHGFLRNVSETCKKGGYFIGTCLDGNTIFQLLETKPKEESHIIQKEGEIMWEVERMYDNVEFSNDETSLGLSVNVFQESIGKKMEEYLVNFAYLKKVLEMYGFHPASSGDVSRWNLSHYSNTFDVLFNQMAEDLETRVLSKKKVKTAADMSSQEKELSFMTRYFIFEKKIDVDAGAVYSTMTGQPSPTPNDNN